MRHRKAGRKFNRSSSHRKAMYSNMVAALVTHGRIETTEAKAKELRRVADRTINWGVKVADLLAADPKSLSQDDRAKLVHARRMAQRVLKDRAALTKLFDEIAPQLAGRQGGYTRILKLANPRLGDAGRQAILEFVGQHDRVRRRAERPAFEDETKDETEAEDLGESEEPLADEVVSEEAEDQAAEQPSPDEDTGEEEKDAR